MRSHMICVRPLSSIKGFSVMLAKGAADKLDDRALHYLARIRGGVDQMADLIEGLLSLVDIQLKEVDLSRLALEVLEVCRSGDTGRVVRTSVAAGMRCTGDPRLIRQVLANLVGNAWKFSSKTPDASIDVGLRPGPEGEAVFFVKDNGAGFDMKHAAKLFGTFQRLHSLSDFEGSGIGLATVRRIVMRHEGRIWAESAPGEGASFYFTLCKAGAGAYKDECSWVAEAMLS